MLLGKNKKYSKEDLYESLKGKKYLIERYRIQFNIKESNHKYAVDNQTKYIQLCIKVEDDKDYIIDEVDFKQYKKNKLINEIDNDILMVYMKVKEALDDYDLNQRIQTEDDFKRYVNIVFKDFIKSEN